MKCLVNNVFIFNCGETEDKYNLSLLIALLSKRFNLKSTDIRVCLS